MKKILLLPLLFCLFLVACDKDEPTEPTGPAANELIQGTWVTLEMKYELFSANGTKLAEKKDVQYDRFTFENGTVTALDPFANPTSATYRVTEGSGSNTSLFMNLGTLPTSFMVLDIDNSGLWLRSDDGGDTQNLGTGLSDKEKKLAITRLTIQLNKIK
ncbi:hypothetical protein [Pontibacter arcticus]|uniref:Lipocalin-like domain-containing protein n=1 Tax=Pontibacter arcticus TaxID=2080288 RepID=A0A364RCA9_9BACT|nr:hypothetical protein [Pontibacter arcticus]RAU81922.1 hypothetical protein DP923_14640 [Pontibacter arcticus]